MRRSPVVLLLGLTVLGCAGRTPPPPPLFPLAPIWEARFEDFVVPPLAVGPRRVFVATRDGRVFGLDRETGAVLWTVEGRPGRIAAGPGRLIVRGEDGRVTSLRVRNGEVFWEVSTAAAGELPPTLDGDRVYVSGRGLVALDVETGRVLWTQNSPSAVTAPPVSTSARLLVGEEDGTLRCLDRATGLPLWTHRTEGPLRAPPLVDEERRRAYLGTTDRRIIEVKLDDGERGWRWKVGADIQSPGLLLPGRVFFASFDAVLYGLSRGGNLAWRAALPSRPVSGPLLLDSNIVIACHEREILGFDVETGRSLGTLRTAAEIRTPPVVSGRQIFVGLRDRSVLGFTVPEADVRRQRQRSRAEEEAREDLGGLEEETGPPDDDPLEDPS